MQDRDLPECSTWDPVALVLYLCLLQCDNLASPFVSTFEYISVGTVANRVLVNVVIEACTITLL